MKLFIVTTSKTTELKVKDTTAVLGGGHLTSKCRTMNNFNKAKDGKSLLAVSLNTYYHLPSSFV